MSAAPDRRPGPAGSTAGIPQPPVETRKSLQQWSFDGLSSIGIVDPRGYYRKLCQVLKEDTNPAARLATLRSLVGELEALPAKPKGSELRALLGSLLPAGAGAVGGVPPTPECRASAPPPQQAGGAEPAPTPPLRAGAGAATSPVVAEPPQEAEAPVPTVAVMVDIDRLQTAEPFRSLFPINPAVLERMADDMRENGFNPAHPVLARMSDMAIIDGHTRVQAARQAGITSVPAVVRDFPDEEAAVRHAIAAQCARRNLTDGDLLCCVRTLDQPPSQGARTDLARGRAKLPDQPRNPKSAEVLGQLLGIGERKVQEIRKVLREADPQTLEAIGRGDTTVHAVCCSLKVSRGRGTEPKPERDAKTAAATSISAHEECSDTKASPSADGDSTDAAAAVLLPAVPGPAAASEPGFLDHCRRQLAELIAATPWEHRQAVAELLRQAAEELATPGIVVLDL